MLNLCGDLMLVGAGGPVALQTFSMGEDSAEAGNSDFCGARPGAGEICRLPRRVFRSWELEGRSPSRPLAPVRSLNRVDTDPHAALRALLVGLRPPTPQSPERLRSTPFDCVAIAPCCFAKRKAVLSHALAALTALKAREKTGLLWKFRSQRRTCLTRARARP